MPKCDLRGLVFEQLESLTLGHWAITHRWQIDWLLAQPALKNLMFDNCSIMKFASLNVPLDEEYYQRDPVPGRAWPREWEPESIWIPGLTWEAVFRALQDAPSLRRVRSGYFEIIESLNSGSGDLLPFERATWIADPESGRAATEQLAATEAFEGGYSGLREGHLIPLRGDFGWFSDRKGYTFRDREKTHRSLAVISEELLAVAQGPPPDEATYWREIASQQGKELRLVDWQALENAERGSSVQDMRALKELEEVLALRDIIPGIGSSAGEGREL
jgi:hypothetical protein